MLAFAPCADGMRRVAHETGAVCKLSGLLTEAGRPAARGAAARWAEHLLDSFGAERVLWGSDWPVLERAARYRDWWGDVQDRLAPVSAAGRAAVLGANAQRSYGL